MTRQWLRMLSALLFISTSFWHPTHAKPIAFAHGTTVMAEYGAGTMREAQVFYAPRYFLSAGLGHLALDSDVDSRSRDITYGRVNYLIKRWNLEAAQANVFSWGGVGRATTDDASNSLFAWNAGGQLDYETRRLDRSRPHAGWEDPSHGHAQLLTGDINAYFICVICRLRGNEYRCQRRYD